MESLLPIPVTLVIVVTFAVVTSALVHRYLHGRAALSGVEYLLIGVLVGYYGVDLIGPGPANGGTAVIRAPADTGFLLLWSKGAPSLWAAMHYVARGGPAHTAFAKGGSTQTRNGPLASATTAGDGTTSTSIDARSPSFLKGNGCDGSWLVKTVPLELVTW